MRPAVNSICQTTSVSIPTTQTSVRTRNQVGIGIHEGRKDLAAEAHAETIGREQLDPGAAAEREADLAVPFSRVAGQPRGAVEKRAHPPGTEFLEPAGLPVINAHSPAQRRAVGNRRHEQVRRLMREQNLDLDALRYRDTDHDTERGRPVDIKRLLRDELEEVPAEAVAGERRHLEDPGPQQIGPAPAGVAEPPAQPRPEGGAWWPPAIALCVRGTW